MKSRKVLPSVAITVWCFMLIVTGVNAERPVEKQLLYEELSKQDKKAVEEEIKANYETIIPDTYKGEPGSVDQSEMAGMNALELRDQEEFKEPKIEPKIDEYLPMTYVRLDHLKKYGEYDPPETLILRRKAIVVPIALSEKVQKNSSLIQLFTVLVPSKVGQPLSKSLWQISQSRSSRDFQALLDGRKEIIEKDYKAEDKTCKCFMIWIPAVKQYFLGDQTSGEFKIKMLRDGPGELKKGQLVSAGIVFMQLAKEARAGKYDWPKFKPQKPLKPQ